MNEVAALFTVHQFLMSQSWGFRCCSSLFSVRLCFYRSTPEWSVWIVGQVCVTLIMVHKFV